MHGMRLATHASITLARFDDLTEVGPIGAYVHSETCFLQAGADVRSASSDPRSSAAFVHLLLGLHSSEGAARDAVSRRLAAAPWLETARESWSAVLLPFRHFGEANLLGTAGPVFEVGASTPPEGTPILIMTSAGWDSAEGEALERIIRFSDNVSAVRIGLGGQPGLLAQHSFGFPGGLATDGVTITLWQNLASAMAFAYGPGLHRAQVKVQREELYGDRTSFTRFTLVHSEGAWRAAGAL